MTGEGWIPISYDGRLFPTAIEARWAVFFDARKVEYHYEPDGCSLRNDDHYLPQFNLLTAGGIWFEVQHPTDGRGRKPMLWTAPEIEEPTVYLAVGDLPTERQLMTVGWWDHENQQGVLKLTAGFEWEKWFPLGSPDVLAALERARKIEFQLSPGSQERRQAQQSTAESADIPPQHQHRRD